MSSSASLPSEMYINIKYLGTSFRTRDQAAIGQIAVAVAVEEVVLNFKRRFAIKEAAMLAVRHEDLAVGNMEI